MLLLSETHRRSIGDLTEIDKPYRRPIWDINMLHRRPIWNRHAPSETDMYKNKQIVYKIYIFKFRLDSAGMLVVDGSPQTCRSPMGHVSLWWVFDLECWSPMGHVGLWWNMSRSMMGLRLGRSVSNGSPIIIIYSWTRQFLSQLSKKSL